ncbi:hypothetical protein OH799_12955 [Nocardia sp. NBC_00881]|uniref:hypothetical protein n=1 Tax=Nocardia sp. NBC_00881 TaxID=2975995 RepID=UPI00386A2949|nr:hypothetical protein OH799_12955 [Nocardia sp. NBC_00881]
MSTVPALQAALDLIDSMMFEILPPFLRLPGLRRVIDIALMPPSPGGSPTSITDRAGDYEAAAKAWNSSAIDLAGVAIRSLPVAWRGAAAATATEAVQALVSQSEAGLAAFQGGADALNVFAEKLAQAQKTDEQGVELLQLAKAATLSPSGSGLEWFEIRDHAAQGCHRRLTAAKLWADAATDVVSALNEFAARARARQINSPGIDPLSSVVLAYAGDDGSTEDPLLGILTPIALERASQLLNDMSEADRKEFENLLGAAESPQEAAHIWKALAAGYSLADVQSFVKLIHPHGNDLSWLSEHLNPNVHSLDTTFRKGGEYILDYKGKSTYTTPAEEKGKVYVLPLYGQDPEHCVAASTVIARAANDPVFMLGLTTGQGPAAVVGATPGDDSSTAFRDRLVHAYGATDATLDNTRDGRAELFTTVLQPSTGDTYTVTSVDGGSPSESAAARQAVLPEIETAVNAGKPVPITVDRDPGEKGGYMHELVIMAARGDKLEIYNPWGYTEWVTKKRFIDGELGVVTDSDPNEGLSNAVDVGLPQ